MRVRFRGQDRRRGVLIQGPAGWGEFSPFPEYDADDRGPLAGGGAGGARTTAGRAPVRDRDPGQHDGPGSRARAGARAGHGVGLRDGEGQGRRARPDARRRHRAGRGGARRARARRSAPGRRERGVGRSMTATTALRELLAFDLEYAEQPVRSARGHGGAAPAGRRPARRRRVGAHRRRTRCGSPGSRRPTSSC